MSGKTSEFQTKPACSVKYDHFPVNMNCKMCGLEVELWADEEETVCSGCGGIIKRNGKG
jgi:rRNA maturation endonuclease Nob1